jgi:hypothetical protein
LPDGVDCFLTADTLRGQLDKLLKYIEEQDWIRGRQLKDRVDQYRDWKKKNLLGCTFSKSAVKISNTIA